MNKSKADSYLQKLKECRLDPIGDPLVLEIAKPYPFSAGFSTGEVFEKALGWQQELAARVRDYQERTDSSIEDRVEAAQLLASTESVTVLMKSALTSTL